MKAMEERGLAPPGAPDRARVRPEVLSKMADVPMRRIAAADPSPTGSVTPDPSAGCAMALVRAGLARIDCLAPDYVPSAAAVACGLPRETRRLCGEALDLSPPAVAAARSALGGLTRGLAFRPRRSLEASVAGNMPSDQDTHDIFFNIRRAAKPEPALYVQSLLETLIAFREDLAETPVNIGVPALARIETGLLTALALALGQGPRRSQGAFTRAAAPAFADHPARRWIRGHQVFAALSQGLIAALAALRKAGEAARPEAAGHVATGLDACAAALEFTGDFADHLYDAQIRPSMCPPHLPRGFSGLLSADHMYLVRSMKEMKADLEALRARAPDAHAAIAAALGRVYDSHKHVCAKFVGTDRSSLLMVDEAGRSSVEQLERFKTMRIRSLG